MSARDKRNKPGRGLNAKGRSKTERYLRFDYWMVTCPAWEALSVDGRAVLLAIWTRYNGLNNGKIPFSVRDAQGTLRSSDRRASRALQDLQEKGFLQLHRKGGFNVKGANPANEWELTALPVPGPGGDRPRKLYAIWKPTRPDSTVVTTTTRRRHYDDPRGQVENLSQHRVVTTTTRNPEIGETGSSPRRHLYSHAGGKGKRGRPENRVDGHEAPQGDMGQYDSIAIPSAFDRRKPPLARATQVSKK